MYCDGCDYWRRLNTSNPPLNACHYCIDTLHCRLCPPQGCPYHTGITKRKIRHKAWHKVAQELYSQGYSDREIANELHFNINTIREWRYRNGLPAVGAKGRPRKEEQRDSA